LPQVSQFIKKSGIDARVPVTTNEVDIAHYECWWEKSEGVLVVLYLKTGDRFVYRHGQVIEFDAIDSESWCAPNSPREDKPPERFYGPVNVSASESMSVVRKAVDQIGWSTHVKELRKQPEVVPPRRYGTNYVARYFFNWWPNSERIEIASAEVDATTKKLKSLFINDRANPKIWSEPPKTDVPLMIDTHAPPPKKGEPSALPPPSLPPPTPIK